MGNANHEELPVLELRIKTILPPEYQETYQDVQPVSMGSAGLKYGKEGKVVWDEIWEDFCDLAMAGGPPHKGTLLQPGTVEEIDANPDGYREAVAEICRGVRMVSGLETEASAVKGWVRVDCESQTSAEWLVRAITMENVSVRCRGAMIKLPAGPHYRIEKEIKNVITAIAKTSHYWFDHTWQSQQREIGDLFVKMSAEMPLVQPSLPGHGYDANAHRALAAKIMDAIHQPSGLASSGAEYPGWLGIECLDVARAIWLMRAMVASNVLSRREGTTLFLPVNQSIDPHGKIVAQRFLCVHQNYSQ
jgi:hypothetical protein